MALLRQGQAADAVALQQAVQRRAGQAWNRGLEGVEAIVERQVRVLAEGPGGRFLFRAPPRGGRFGPPRRVRRGGALAPLGHRFRVDALALG